jgi:hypothetical protein
LSSELKAARRRRLVVEAVWEARGRAMAARMADRPAWVTRRWETAGVGALVGGWASTDCLERTESPAAWEDTENIQPAMAAMVGWVKLGELRERCRVVVVVVRGCCRWQPVVLAGMGWFGSRLQSPGPDVSAFWSDGLGTPSSRGTRQPLEGHAPAGLVLDVLTVGELDQGRAENVRLRLETTKSPKLLEQFVLDGRQLYRCDRHAVSITKKLTICPGPGAKVALGKLPRAKRIIVKPLITGAAGPSVGPVNNRQ